MEVFPDVIRVTGTPALLATRLANIPTNDATLKSAHQAFLEQDAAPLLRRLRNPFVDLVGFASKSGGSKHNQDLSDLRVAAVERKIASLVAGVGFRQLEGKGESESTGGEHDNSGFWRAVEVRVFEGTPPPPQPEEKERVRSTVRDSTRFRIKLLKIDDPFFGLFSIEFKIVDDIKRISASFKFSGPKRTTSPPNIPGIQPIPVVNPKKSVPGDNEGGAGVKDFAPFVTTRSARLGDFVGQASVTQRPGTRIGGRSLGGQLLLRLQSTRLSKARIHVSPQPLVFEIAQDDIETMGFDSFGVLEMTSPETRHFGP